MHVSILGTRGVPSNHSGFETFAQDFALFLLSRGHQVTVYCQLEENEAPQEDTWNGIRRVSLPAGKGPVGTMAFDWKAIKHSMRDNSVILTLGYNTGVSNHLVADHPEIGRHLARHTPKDKISVIPYGADSVTSAPESVIQKFHLSPKAYHILIARPEPENYILEIVRAYSQRERGIPLVILGRYRHDGTPYQKTVLEAAGPEIRFLGPIFDRAIVKALRFHARAYFHGHRVGGTNPSLVEALGAGNAVIAHDNRFNRWVAGEGARYFRSASEIDAILESLAADPAQLLAMEDASRKRHHEAFTQDQVLSKYEELLALYVPAVAPAVEVAKSGDMRVAS